MVFKLSDGPKSKLITSNDYKEYLLDVGKDKYIAYKIGDSKYEITVVENDPGELAIPSSNYKEVKIIEENDEYKVIVTKGLNSKRYHLVLDDE